MIMVSLVLAIFSVSVFLSSFIIHTHHMRKVLVGGIGIVTAMSMYSSPLVAVKQVMRTKSVEFMPFYLSLFSFLTSLAWMVYGILGRDPYIKSPNCVGCFTGILQLVVYCIYSRCEKPPKTLSDIEQANDVVVATSCEDANGWIAWAIWNNRNMMAIRKQFPKKPIDIILQGVSFLQKWKILLRPNEKMRVEQIVEKMAGWLQEFSPNAILLSEVVEI